MKSFQSFFASIVLLLCCMPLSAHDFEVDGIYYNITSNAYMTVEVTYQGDNYSFYTEYSGAVTIPESVTYSGKVYSVTSIGDRAFGACSGLTSITIPNSVTSIGGQAFDRCSGLTSIIIPNSVTSIGAAAFGSCSGLTSITIPNSVTSIGNQAFYGCSGLTSITIPNSVTSIEAAAFSGCSGLTSIVVVPGNPKYDSRDNCNAIIETDANTLVVGCKSTVIPNSVSCIGEYAFYGCSGLTSITIPNSVTSIGNRAFYGCSGLTSITIPNSVASIGDYAFSSCSGLTSITIPNSVASIGGRAFYGTPWYKNQPDGVIYINKVLNCYKGAMPENTSISVKEGTLSISSNAFESCSGLTSITIPNSVTSIGDQAFSGCSGLTSITIPNSVTSIGVFAFSGCSGLTSITIPNSVTSIGYYAFCRCSALSSITIPNSVTSIGDQVFAFCSGLTSIVVDAGNPKYDSRDNCNAIIEKATNTLVCGCKTTIIPNTVTNIASGAFYECSGLTSVFIPNSVTNIEDGAFYKCNNLTSIVVALGNPTYDSRDNCNAIIEKATNTLVNGCKTTIIPNSVTSIGNQAFYGCSGLTSITIPNSVTSIGDYAFYGCSGLTNITIPNSVTSIGDYAFYGCSGLTELISEAEVPPTCDNSVFGFIDKSICYLYVPSASIDAYQGKQPWSDFGAMYSIEEKPIGELHQLWSTYCPNGIEAWYSDAVGIRLAQYDEASVGAFQEAYAAYAAYRDTNEGDPVALLEQAKVACQMLKLNEMAEGYYYVVSKTGSSGVYDANGAMRATQGFGVPIDAETGKPTITFESAKYIWKFTANEGEAPTYNVQNYITSRYVNTSEHNDQTGIKTGDLDQAVPYTLAFYTHNPGVVLLYNLDDNGEMTCSWNRFSSGVIGNWLSGAEKDPNNFFLIYPIDEELAETMEATLKQYEINQRLQTAVDAAYSSYQSGFAYMPDAECTMNDNFSSHGYLTYENSEEGEVVSNLTVVNDWGTPVVHPTDGEGSVAGLLDNDLSTYTHTLWRGTTYPHYFEIDLGEDSALDAISVKFMRRYDASEYNASFTSKEMDVYARNSADEAWEKVNRLVINYNIPLYHRGNNGNIVVDGSGNKIVDKENFVGVGACGLGDSYRYIRLAHTKTINDKTNTYFSGSEMALFGATYAEAKSLNSLIPASILDNLVAELGQAKAQLAAGKATEAQITALQEAYDAYLEKLAEVKEAYGSQEVTLVDGKVYENSGSRDVAKVTYTRTLSKTNVWNAFYVPFNIPVTPEFFEKYHVGYFNDIHSFDQYVGDKANGVLGSDGVIDGMEMEVLKVREGAVLKANYPYLIAAKNSSALKMNIVVEDATLHRAEETTVTCSSVFMKFDVTGIYTPKTSGDLKGEFNVYAMSGGGWKQAVNDAVKLNPYRLYLSLTTIAGSPVKVSPGALNAIQIRVEGEDETTSIEGLELTDTPQQTGVVYDLMGRPVANPQKGLYIVNGKKVYIK